MILGYDGRVWNLRDRHVVLDHSVQTGSGEEAVDSHSAELTGQDQGSSLLTIWKTRAWTERYRVLR